MANNVIIEHKDGRAYSTTREGFEKLYKEEGFKITGEETPAAFAVEGVPRPRRVRTSPRAKTTRRAAPARPVASASETPAKSEG